MLEVALAFLAGLLIGSFLNVCIFRLPRDLSVVQPRSFCPACEKTISWYDNIPLVSYILLRARCRNCGERIPLRYPLVELATAVAFAVCVSSLGVSPAAFEYSIFSAILITLIASDLEERILPDEFTLGGMVIGLAFSPFVPLDPGFAHLLLPLSMDLRWKSMGESVLGAAIPSGVLWLLGWTYLKLRHREGLGLGDVKMIAMVGAFLGLNLALLTLIAASLLGSVVGFVYILAKRKDAATYEIPFGSFLGMAALGVAIFGKVVMVWYSGIGH